MNWGLPLNTPAIAVTKGLDGTRDMAILPPIALVGYAERQPRTSSRQIGYNHFTYNSQVDQLFPGYD